MAKTRKRALTRQELAAALGVHPGSISRYERDGMPVLAKHRRGVATLFDLRAVRAWLKAHQHDPAAASREQLREALAQKERAYAREAEQRIAIRSGDLVEAAAVEREMVRQVMTVRTLLQLLPHTHAERVHTAAVAGVEAVRAEIHTILEREVLAELKPLAAGRRA